MEGPLGGASESLERVRERGRASERMPSRAAVGWISFAGILMVIAAGFKILQGLGWVINPNSLFPASKDAVLGQSATL